MKNRHFVSEKRRTSAYESAVSALKALPADLVSGAYSEAMTQRNQEFLEERYGRQRQATLGKPLGRYLGIQGPSDLAEASAMGSKWGADHVRLHRKTGEKFGTVTSQPYGMTLRHMRALVEFCDQHNLDCTVDTGSPHFPDRCLLIVLRRKEDVQKEDQARIEKNRAQIPEPSNK
jgi:hypothetical protein